MMPRKKPKRKALQAEKRKRQDDQKPLKRTGIITHHAGGRSGLAILAALLNKKDQD